MEENKYYTPEITEFHVGFEYEVKGSNNIEFTWFKTTYENDLVNKTDDNFSINLSRFMYRLNHQTIRVKYLDKEDIESLGFKYHELHNLDYTVKQSILLFNRLIYSERDNKEIEVKINYNTRNNWCLIYQSVNDDLDNTRFSGYIKNKSALKQLLKQLGIETSSNNI